MHQVLAMAFAFVSLLSNPESWALACKASAAKQVCTCCTSHAPGKACHCDTAPHQTPQPAPLTAGGRNEGLTGHYVPMAAAEVAILNAEFIRLPLRSSIETSIRPVRRVPKYILHCSRLC